MSVEQDDTGDDETVRITIERTPHPRTVKFIVEQDVLTHGEATFTRQMVPPHMGPMIPALLVMRVVEQVHLRGRVVTVTIAAGANRNLVIEDVRELIAELLPLHKHGSVVEPEPVRVVPDDLSADAIHLQRVLDETVGPYIASHGGDVRVLGYDAGANVVIVDFGGSCGSCGASGGSTLHAVESILRDELGEEVTVTAANP